MGTRRLLHWTVEYYPTSPQPYVAILLEGDERRGLLSRHAVLVAERLVLPIECVGFPNYQANQALVRRAMRQSRHHWRGRVP
jgi:hypothetical protein